MAVVSSHELSSVGIEAFPFAPQESIRRADDPSLGSWNVLGSWKVQGGRFKVESGKWKDGDLQSGFPAFHHWGLDS